MPALLEKEHAVQYPELFDTLPMLMSCMEQELRIPIQGGEGP